MGKHSSIEWCDHTFNPWAGCVKVSPGCAHCYAETLSKRFGQHIWGPAKTTPRRMMRDAYWRQPLTWNAHALSLGVRKRVFCASMADVFEDHPMVASARLRLWDLIEQTPGLDWLLLTKRPEHVHTMLPAAWLATPPHNVWFGTSVEDQQRANERIPALLNVPAAVRVGRLLVAAEAPLIIHPPETGGDMEAFKQLLASILARVAQDRAAGVQSPDDERTKHE